MKSFTTDCNGTTLELLWGDIARIASGVVVEPVREEVRPSNAAYPLRDAFVNVDCSSMARCSTGDTVATSIGQPSERRVYQTVVPTWTGGKAEEAYLLSSCYVTALTLAEDEGHAAISLPGIGSAGDDYPADLAASTALAAIGAWLRKPHRLKLVRLVMRDEDAYETYRETLAWFAMEEEPARTNVRCRAVFRGTTSPEVFGLAWQDLAPSAFSHDLVEALGCPCLEFHRADSMQSVMEVFGTFQTLGKRDGFLPLLMYSEICADSAVKQGWVPEKERKTAEEAADEASKLDVPAWIAGKLNEFDKEELDDWNRDEGDVSPVKERNDITYGFVGTDPAYPCDPWTIILARIPETRPWMLPFWVTSPVKKSKFRFLSLCRRFPYHNLISW